MMELIVILLGTAIMIVWVAGLVYSVIKFSKNLDVDKDGNSLNTTDSIIKLFKVITLVTVGYLLFTALIAFLIMISC